QRTRPSARGDVVPGAVDLCEECAELLQFLVILDGNSFVGHGISIAQKYADDQEGGGWGIGPAAGACSKTQLANNERSPVPDGEDARRERRGRRGVLGGGNAETSEPFSATALVSQ